MSYKMKKKVEEEKDGDYESVFDLYFKRIGKAIPILPADHHFPVDSLPSQPLSLSLPHRLLFLAHASSGFCVARTKDVMDAAAAADGGRSVRDVCLADVAVASGVRILSVSHDGSTLAAASFSHVVHFFSVPSLLDKDETPSFSCSVDPSSTIKSLEWRKMSSHLSFLLLSHQGKLHHGVLGAPLQDVSDNVDAVEWSPQGNYVALAKEDNISILSSDFSEKFSISLTLKPWIGDSNHICIVKVDSIRWVRQDSLIVGCFQLTDDGEEESYLLQVVRSKNGKIIDVDSELVVVSFHDLYSGIVDDIMPSESGPYLLMAYLKQRQLAIAAHRKNVDGHIVYFGWSEINNNTEVASLEIESDSWVPRIELQGNGDDNLVLGLCIDEVSLYGKVKVEIGYEEFKEFSPSCVLLCVTLEGKLVMFNVASGTDTDLQINDEEEDSLDELSAGSEQRAIPATLDEQTLKQNDIGLGLEDRSGKDHKIDGVLRKDLNTSLNMSSARVGLENKSHVDNVGSYREMGSMQKNQSSLTNGLSQSPSPGMHYDSNQQISASGNQVGFGQSLFKPSLLEGSAGMMDDSRLGAKNFASYGPGQVSLPAKVPPVAFGQSNNKELQKSIGATKEWSEGRPSSSNFSVRQTQRGGPKLLFTEGRIESLPSIFSQPLSLQDDFALGNNVSYASKVSHKAASNSSPEPNLSRQNASIKAMIDELDALMKDIEEPGGFMDASTAFQRNATDELERGTRTLLRRCTTLKSMIDGRLNETQYLLDGTVQVLARKLHLEGIIKQSSDMRYWELWDQQRLSSEFEMKRRRILQLNQDMTNQIIELERHFNNTEFQKFSEQDGCHIGRRTIQSQRQPARSYQPLLTLHSTMNSQLAAAEHLSECLSKQMALLRVESPAKPKNAQKELFEMIGIPLDNSFSSPDATKKAFSSSKNLLLSSGSASTKDQSRRLQQSAPKCSDPETSRRRRDSLGTSWANFEPTKTTVKRMLLQDQEGIPSKSLSLFDRHNSSSPLMGKPLSAHSEDQKNHSTLIHPSRNKVAGFASENQGFDDKRLQLGSTRHMLPTVQGIEPSSPFSVFSGSHPVNQNLAKENHKMTVDTSSNLIQKPPQLSGARSMQTSSIEQSRSKSSFIQDNTPSVAAAHGSRLVGQNSTVEAHKESAEKSSISIQKHVDQPETTPPQKSGSLAIPFSFMNKASEVQKTDTVSASTPFTGGSVKQESVLAKMSAFGSTSLTLSSSSLSNVSVALDQPIKVPQYGSANNKVQPGDKASSSPSFSIALSVSPSNTPSQSPPAAALPSSESAPIGLFSQAASTPLKSSTVSVQLPTQFVSSDDSVVPTSSKPSAATSEPCKLERQPVTAEISTPTSSTISEYPKAALAQPQSQSSPALGSSKVAEGSAFVNPSILKSESSNAEVQTPISGITPTNNDATTAALLRQPQLPAFGFKLEAVASSSPIVAPPELSAKQVSLDNIATSGSRLEASAAQVLVDTSAPPPTNNSEMPENLDNADGGEDDMEEEATVTAQGTELSLGSLGGFGIGPTSVPANAAAANPFGGSFSNVAPNQASSSFTMTVPSGELFRPASFSFSSAMPSVQSPPSVGGFSGGFGAAATIGQAPAQSAFGQPAHVGAGQQALGSVLGSFGQSRQIGGALSGSGFGSPSGGFGNASSASGFSNPGSVGGFAGASTAGGFAALASGGGGFAAAATGGGGFAAGAGFAAAANAGGGFGSGGFAAAATPGGGFGGASSAAGGGFGAFGNQQATSGFGFGGNLGGSQQGAGGFSSFGGNSAGAGKPSELFTQMRK